MPRRLRTVDPEQPYHVVSRGTARGPIVADDHDRRALVELLALAVERYRWTCFAYCLMDNHVHLIVRANAAGALPAGMRWLTGVHAARFNRRHERVGHLFQGRYFASGIDSEGYFVEALRYVVLNPVRAQQCRQAADWPWSSYRASAGLEPVPGFLAVSELHRIMDQYHGGGAVAYRAVVERPLPAEGLTPT